MSSVTINHTTKSYPRLPFDEIKRDILGARYDLSLNFIGATRAQALNQETRGKDYVPNVLSFPLTDDAGEIYIAPTVAKREAPKFGMTPRTYITFLYIHGLLHLKGYDHGPKMESLEQKYLRRYAPNHRD